LAFTLGGVDLLFPHHENEIAQSEGKTGKKFVNYFIHGEHMMVDGKKMSKSLNNFYTIKDIEKKGFAPLALRYLFLTAHYRDPLNFTWDSLKSALTALGKLKNQISSLKKEKGRMTLSPEKQEKVEDYRNRFTDAINNDLNTPQALAVLWEVMKSNIPGTDKLDLALSFDEVLGLGLDQISEPKAQISSEVKELIAKRDRLRKAGKFEESDAVREKIESLGHKVQDSPLPAKNEKNSK